MKTGKVYLTGGGCGDVELMTLRAYRLLRSCDVLIYDSLVSEKLLSWTAADCEKIYVGKRYGRHAMRQSEINALLAAKAREGKTVVRLKGGDPYVFGRGGEEFLALRAEGICCEEIPGITSAIAVPAAAGIPVTHRGRASSVTVVTGTAASEDGGSGLAMNFDVLAQLDGTLVILMGMHHLQEITEGLMTAGKSPDTPCAVIMEGTTARQRCMRAPLCDLAEEARRQGMGAPAVIVIGSVAELELLADEETTDLSMEGITVGVVGTPHFLSKMSAALAGTGAAVCDMSFVEIRQSEEPLPELPMDGWLVFTSANGVAVFLDKMKRERRDLRALCGVQIAVIGPGTAEALAEAGVYADYQPEIYDTIHLAQGLAERMTGQACKEAGNNSVFLRARQGSPELPRIFQEKNIPFKDYPLYDVEIREDKRAVAILKKPDYIVFGSAMNARAYFEGLEKAGVVNDTSRYVCIGTICAEAVRNYTKDAPLIAAEPSAEAIVARLLEEEKGRIRS